jgi:hypothetical protein
MGDKIGFEGKLYYKASPLVVAADRTSWTELTIVKDVTLGDTTGEADVTKRYNAGKKATDYGLRDLSPTFAIAQDPTNAGYDVIKAAYVGKTMVAIAVMDGAIATADGFAANWMIADFSRAEPLGEHMVRNVTLKYNDFGTDFNET